jgi:hypothetical protein
MKKIIIARKALKMCVIGFVAVIVSPQAALAGVASQTLTGIGLPLVELMILAAFGWIGGYIASALGNGQIAGMIKVTCVFLAIGLVIGIVVGAISKVAGAFGLSL